MPGFQSKYTANSNQIPKGRKCKLMCFAAAVMRVLGFGHTKTNIGWCQFTSQVPLDHCRRTDSEKAYRKKEFEVLKKQNSPIFSCVNLWTWHDTRIRCLYLLSFTLYVHHDVFTKSFSTVLCCIFHLMMQKSCIGSPLCVSAGERSFCTHYHSTEKNALACMSSSKPITIVLGSAKVGMQQRCISKR